MRRHLSSSSLFRQLQRRSLTTTSTKASAPPLVTLKKDGPHVSIIRLNCPSKMNALTVAVGHAFLATVNEVCADKEVRAIVLTGEGKAFSAGGDLAWLRERQSDKPDHNR